MKTIKTRNTGKNIKVFDKSVKIAAHTKNAYVRTKTMADETQNARNSTPTEYAGENVQNTAHVVVRKTVHHLPAPLRKPRQNADLKEDFNKTDNVKRTAQETKEAVRDVKQTLRGMRQERRQNFREFRQNMKLGKNAKVADDVKNVVPTARPPNVSAIKTAKKSINTSKQTTKTVQIAAKSATVARKTTRAAAKTAVHTTKTTVKSITASIKSAIAAAKGLVTTVAAGGGIAVMIILIICMIALLLGSAFGIFFSGEDSGVEDNRTMPTVIAELTTKFYDKVEKIKNENEYDVLNMDVMSIDWAEVLAVYAVKVNTDSNNAMEVVTLDDDKVAKLRGVLNDMVSLSYSLKTETQSYTVTDSNGNATTQTVSITVLTISMTQKSADEMAVQYGFSQTNKDQLHELLNPEYAGLWAALLGSSAPEGDVILSPDSSYIPKDIFSWPLGERFTITSNFGYRIDPINGTTTYHSGIDIAAPLGTPILAAADGTVVIANSTDAWGGGYGYHVKIQHSGGYATFYAHASKIVVVSEQEVKKGQVIAYVGSTGRSTGPHLHFEVWKNGVRTDPLAYFD